MQARKLTACTVNKGILEQKIAETLALPPRKSDLEHAAVNGRKNAAAIIEQAACCAAKRKDKYVSPPPLSSDIYGHFCGDQIDKAG